MEADLGRWSHGTHFKTVYVGLQRGLASKLQSVRCES